MPYKDPAAQKAAQRQHYLDNKEFFLERQRIYRQEKRAKFEEYKKTLKCEQCGENHPATLDFHHDDPSKKVLCSNCHRKLHYKLKHQTT